MAAPKKRGSNARMPYTPAQSVLLVGEGNFSFGRALVGVLGSGQGVVVRFCRRAARGVGQGPTAARRPLALTLGRHCMPNTTMRRRMWRPSGGAGVWCTMASTPRSCTRAPRCATAPQRPSPALTATASLHHPLIASCSTFRTAGSESRTRWAPLAGARPRPGPRGARSGQKCAREPEALGTLCRLGGQRAGSATTPPLPCRPPFLTAAGSAAPDGEIHITVKLGEPYDAWAVPRMCAMEGSPVELKTAFTFDPALCAPPRPRAAAPF